MLKIKHFVIPSLAIAISLGSVSAATKTEKSIASFEKDLIKVVSFENDLIKVVSLLGDEPAKALVVPSKTKQTNILNPLEVKDLVGLDLKQYVGTSKAEKKKASKNTLSLKKLVKGKGISQSTYRKVMRLSTKRTKRSTYRYRPCYKDNYQEIQVRSRRYQDSITQASRKHGVNENLIKSVITAESCFKIRARSHKGARGLMQLMPATARRFGVRNSYNSHQNIGAGTKYLRWLLDRYRGNVHFALAGYNAGEGKVDRYGGIPPYKETREYVRRVMGVYKTLHGKKSTSAYNANYSGVKSRDHYRKVWLNSQKAKQKKRPMHLRRCVEAAPGHLKNITYLKRSGRGGSVWRRYYKLNNSENLANITQKTGVHINALKRLNRLSSYSKLAPGQQLIVWECRT